MRKSYLIIIFWFISIVMIISMSYVFWWSLIFTNGEYFIVKLNSIGEFLFEFIILNCLFFYVNFLFIKFYRNLKCDVL